MNRLVVILAALLCSCDDEQPITADEYRVHKAIERDVSKVERIKGCAGRAVHFCGDPTLADFHIRRDCPALKGQERYTLGGKVYTKAVKEVRVLKSGRITDEKGFFYDLDPCSRCVP